MTEEQTQEVVSKRQSFGDMLGESLGSAGDLVWDDDSGTHELIGGPEEDFTDTEDASDEDVESDDVEETDDTQDEEYGDDESEVEEEDEADDEGDPEETSGQNWEKRFKDTQAALTKKTQELTETNSELSKALELIGKLDERLAQIEKGDGVTRQSGESGGRVVTEADIEDALLDGDSQKARQLMKRLLEQEGKPEGSRSEEPELDPALREVIVEREVRKEFEAAVEAHPDFLALAEGIQEVMRISAEAGNNLTFEQGYTLAKKLGYDPNPELLPPGEAPKKQAKATRTKGGKGKVTKESARDLRAKASKLTTERGTGGGAANTSPTSAKSVREALDMSLEQLGLS